MFIQICSVMTAVFLPLFAWWSSHWVSIARASELALLAQPPCHRAAFFLPHKRLHDFEMTTGFTSPTLPGLMSAQAFEMTRCSALTGRQSLFVDSAEIDPELCTAISPIPALDGTYYPFKYLEHCLESLKPDQLQSYELWKMLHFSVRGRLELQMLDDHRRINTADLKIIHDIEENTTNALRDYQEKTTNALRDYQEKTTSALRDYQENTTNALRDYQEKTMSALRDYQAKTANALRDYQKKTRHYQKKKTNALRDYQEHQDKAISEVRDLKLVRKNESKRLDELFHRESYFQWWVALHWQMVTIPLTSKSLGTTTTLANKRIVSSSISIIIDEKTRHLDAIKVDLGLFGKEVYAPYKSFLDEKKFSLEASILELALGWAPEEQELRRSTAALQKEHKQAVPPNTAPTKSGDA